MKYIRSYSDKRYGLENWCCAFCRDKDTYEGNVELIKKGAIPIDETWDADVTQYTPPEPEEVITDRQMSLF